MKKHIVLTTSSSGLDDNNIPHNIQQIRLHLHVNNVEFIDGKNINLDTLNDLMFNKYTGPVFTSPATRGEINILFAELHKMGYTEVFIITLSSKLSESYQIIREVARSFKDKMKISIYDSREINACEYILALEADHMLSNSRSTAEIFSRLDQLRNSHKMLVAVNNIQHLIKNKKVSNMSGFFANLFDIKPVLTISEEGEVVPINKVRNINKALDYVVNSFDSILSPDNNSFVYILTGNDEQLTNRLVRLVKSHLKIEAVPVIPASSISIANHGPSVVALCAFQNEMPIFADYYQ